MSRSNSSKVDTDALRNALRVPAGGGHQYRLRHTSCADEVGDKTGSEKNRFHRMIVGMGDEEDDVFAPDGHGLTPWTQGQIEKAFSNKNPSRRAVFALGSDGISSEEDDDLLRSSVSAGGLFGSRVDSADHEIKRVTSVAELASSSR